MMSFPRIERWNIVLLDWSFDGRGSPSKIPLGKRDLLDDADLQPAVGQPGIAAAVDPFQDLVEIVDEIFFRQVASLPQVVEKQIAFGIDVRSSDMGNLSGLFTEAHAFIEDGSADPDGPAFFIL